MRASSHRVLSVLVLASWMAPGLAVSPAPLEGHCVFHLAFAAATTASVLASLELAKRLARAEVPRRRALRNPWAVVSYPFLRYTVRDQEVVGAPYMDVRNRLIGEREIYRGTLERAVVEPRERTPPSGRSWPSTPPLREISPSRRRR